MLVTLTDAVIAQIEAGVQRLPPPVFILKCHVTKVIV